MAISMSKYVDISSTFPTGSIADRSFGGLVFTPTAMLADADATTKAAYEGGERVGLSLTEVENCFGTESYEYEMAKGYYSYSSPTGNFASRLSFAFVKNIEAAKDYVANVAYAKGAFVKHTAGEVTTTYKCTTAVTKEENTSWDVVSSKFAAATSADNEAPTSAFSRILSTYDMFGSFTFLNGKGDTARKFTHAELVSVAGVNNGKGQFLFVANEVRGDQTATGIVELKKDFNSAKGCAFVCGANEWSAYMPMAIFAATDYDTGVICNQMFRQFPGETPSVNGDEEYTIFKNGGVNFYGRTQCNGTTFDFYQHGINTNGTDTSIFCNEIWFKSACAKSLLSYMVNSGRIPANAAGIDLIKTKVLEICNDAKANGSFMTKTVSSTDQATIKLLISQKGGTSEEATDIITDVALYGYSVWAQLDTKDGDYICHYYVFYGTGDSIKMIVGDDILLK